MFRIPDVPPHAIEPARQEAQHGAVAARDRTTMTFRRKTLALALASLAGSTSVAALEPPVARVFDPHLAVEPIDAKSAGEAGRIVLRVQLDGTSHRLVLEPNTDLETQAARFVPVAGRRQHWLYRGEIAQRPESWVRLSLSEGLWSGVIWDGGDMWNLAAAAELPLLARAARIPPDGQAVYRGNEAWSSIDLGDDARAMPFAARPARPPMAARSTAKGATFSYNLGLSIVLDTEFQSLYGDEAARAVAIVNIVDGYYERTTDTSVYLNELQLLPAGNAGMVGQDTDTLLTQLETYVQTPAAPDLHAATHLLTGKNAVSGGLAYVGSICMPQFAIGVSAGKHDPATTAALLAHELGHNYGADHDGQPGPGQACPISGFVMQPTVVIGNPPDDFSTCSIASFAQTAGGGDTCLSDPVPGNAFFEDGFED